MLIQLAEKSIAFLKSTLTLFLSTLHPVLFKQFLIREVSTRYLGSISGYFWVIIQPLAQLVLFSFVFGTIFKVRFPELEQHNFMVFVALALWPWLAFQEGVQRATLSMVNNAGLIKKIAMPFEILVYSSVAGSFMIHGAGYFLVILIINGLGSGLALSCLPGVMLLFFELFILAIAVGFCLSALQVFMKDIEHILAPVFMGLFYASPILYPATLLPEPIGTILDLNPLSYFFERFRSLLMFGEWQPTLIDGTALVACLLLLALSLRFFRRCSDRFEEFL